MRFFLLFLMFFMPISSFAQEDPVWWQSFSSYPLLPLSEMERVLARAYTVISEKSLTPVLPSTLAFESVKSLSTLDRKVSAEKNGPRVLILADGKILRSFSAPNDSDALNWARVTLASMVTLRPYSDKALNADQEEFYNIFLNASLATLDPYSHYEPSTQMETLKNPASIGIKYRRTGKYLEITDILPDGPASASDIEIGDRILKIDHKPIVDLSNSQVLNLLQGEKESNVTLTLRKNAKEQTRILKRSTVKTSPVSYYFDQENRILTLKIASFSEKTLKALKVTLEVAKKEKAKGLIIDLRGNMGGLLKEALLTADFFLPENLNVIQTKGPHVQANQKYTSTFKKDRPLYPIVILVDAKTASSAEFFAGTLQDHGVALLVGTTTYGKAQIQTVETLPNQATIYLTWAKFLLPTHYSPDGFGLYPQICTSGKKLSNINTLSLDLKHPQQWQSASDVQKKAMKLECKPENRTNNALDDEIARRLILDSSKFSLDSTLK